MNASHQRADIDIVSGEIEIAAETSIEDGLAAAIQMAESLNPSDYTAASWARLNSPLNTARNTRNNPSATQTQIDNALNNLLTAINALVPTAVIPATPSVDFADLDAAILTAEALAASNYTAASWARLNSPLNAARNTRNNATATQAMIDNAANNLRNAINSLVLRAP